MGERREFLRKRIRKRQTREGVKHKTPDQFPDQGFRWGQGLAPDVHDRRVGQVIQERASARCSNSPQGFAVRANGHPKIPAHSGGAHVTRHAPQVKKGAYFTFLKPAGTSKSAGSTEPMFTETNSVDTVIKGIKPPGIT